MCAPMREIVLLSRPPLSEPIRQRWPRFKINCLRLLCRFRSSLAETIHLCPLQMESTWSTALPHAKLDILESGHLVWEDDADNYARVLSDWVKQKYLQA